MMSVFIEVSATIFDSILCVYFITKFNKASLKNNYLAMIAFIFILGVTLIGDYIAADFNILFNVLLLLISLFYAIIISKKHFFSAVFSACIFTATLIFSSTILFYIFSNIFDDFENLLYGSGEYTRYIYIFLDKLLIFTFLNTILLFNRKKSKYESKINGILTYIFSLISVVGLCLLVSLSIHPFSTNKRLLFLAFIFVFLNALLYFLLYKISDIYNKYYELNTLKEISKHEDKKYHEALQLWQASEKIRHDTKQHMIAISGFIRDGQLEKCQSYINEYFDQITTLKKFSESGNSVIDYIIETKLSPLTETEIIVRGYIGDLSDFKDTDLASLIGNILDNAIEAVKKEDKKCIALHFGNYDNKRVIICKNSISFSVLKNNAELKSTKDSVNHGYGHCIISDIVNKYNGELHYFEEKNMFGIQIVFPGISKSERLKSLSNTNSDYTTY